LKAFWLTLGTVFVLSFVLLLPASLRAQDKFEVFGGYSYLRASVNETGTLLCPGPPCPTGTFTDHPSLNGWEGSFMYKPVKDLAVVADFGGNYGSLRSNLGGESTHRNTYLFGPQVSFPARVSPFVHVLVGGVHESTGAGAVAFFFPAHSGNAFAIALGGGIDLKVLPLVWVRLIQVDYMGTHFVSSFQNQQRVSAGVVFHF
jgi:hypothetical protein